MSQDRGGQLVRQTSPRPSARPSLERPSLFAEMDSAIDAPDGGTQRVRILSTLESTRQATRLSPTRRKRRPLRLPKNWQLTMLMGMMAIGVLTLLTAFALIILNGHRAGDQADANAPGKTERPLVAGASTARANSNNPLAALMAAPVSTVATATSAPANAQPAVIETIDPTPPVARLPAPPAPAMPTLAAAPTTSPKPTALHTVLATQGSHPAMLAASAATSSTTRSIDATAYAAMTTAKPTKPAARRNQSRDDDVALLEAMFAHTGSNRAASPPPMSAAEEIKTRCDVQSGAAAATCRARVCVQNPSAPICHQDP
ncbi:MAG: hypothetical protein QM749_12950 [Aquabacterium sp.]